MAKLKAPLLSLGASGAIGKAIVFFPWKGLNCAREFVVPANPKTSAQNTQRGYLRDAVAAVHAAQVVAIAPFDADDATAYALWGSTYSTPRTWFNQVVMQAIYQKSHSLSYTIWRAHAVSGAAASFEATIRFLSGLNVAAGRFHYGPSKTNLLYSVEGSLTNDLFSATLPDVIAGTKYYVQFRPTTTAFVGSLSGIFYGTPT